MESILEKITLTLPDKQDSIRNTIKSLEQYDRDIGNIYGEILDRKLDELDHGKYGENMKDYTFDPSSGWYGDEQVLSFELPMGSVKITLIDLIQDPDCGFNEPYATIECETYDNDDECVLDYLSIDSQECEYECLENTLDVLFTEIAKFK